MRTIIDAIREHKERILQDYAESQLLGIFLYGSQNYGISTEKSDVDTNAIIIPTVKDLCLGKPVSREIQLDNGEYCKIKDIREMARMFAKQNINFIEILFTDYCWINPKYNHIWREYFINNREEIAHMHERYTIMSICGQAIHTLKQNKTDGKKFANGLRLYHFLKNYLERVPYSSAINVFSYSPELAAQLIDYKLGKLTVNEDETNELIAKFLWFESTAESYDKNPKPETEKLLADGVMALITNEQPLFDFYK